MEKNKRITDIHLFELPAKDLGNDMGYTRVANMILLGAYLERTKVVTSESNISSLKKVLYLYVVTGSGTFIIDGQETVVSEADLIHVGGEEELAFNNTSSEPVSLYVVLSKVPSEQFAKNI